MKRLSEAEFQVMKAVWAYDPPVTSSMAMGNLAGEKHWPIQTVVTLLSRLAEKGFLRSEKGSKERRYYPLVSKEEYLRAETVNFIRQYHENSLASLLSALDQDMEWTDNDLNGLQDWIRKRRAD